MQLVTKEKLITETKRDENLQKLIQLIRMSRGRDKYLREQPELNKFRRVLDELSVTEEGLILRNHRIVIPTSLQEQIVNLAHEGHQGIIRTKQLIREHVWFGNIDKMVEDKIANCPACQCNSDTTHIEPLIMSEIPSRPWQYISVDFYEFDKIKLVLLLCEHARFPIVEHMKTTTATKLIETFERVFSIFGYPEKIKTDNGPPFDSHELRAYFSAKGINHQRITPYWPRANGEAERFMRNLNKLFRSAKLEGKDWKSELQIFLSNYRSTPHRTTGIVPASLMTRTKPPALVPIYSKPDHKHLKSLKEQDKKAKDRIKFYGDKHLHVKHAEIEIGDTVLMKQNRFNKIMSRMYSKKFQFIDKKGTMITAKREDRIVTRNSSFFKKIPPRTSPGKIQPRTSQQVFDNSIVDSVHSNLYSNQFSLRLRLVEDEPDESIELSEPGQSNTLTPVSELDEATQASSDQERTTSRQRGRKKKTTLTNQAESRTTTPQEPDTRASRKSTRNKRAPERLNISHARLKR